MEINEILSKVDHTLLSVTASESDIIKICKEGMRYNVASICIAPCHIRIAREFLKNNLSICTVVGFPNGYNTCETKMFETENALSLGADEIDMVINIGALKEKNFKKVESEIYNLKKICDNKILKVIVETCLLTEEEKITMCKIVTDSGADYIKTSTGFSKSGATLDDIILFSKNIGKNVKIKAAGGISSLEDAERFIEVGASRLGTSRIVKIVSQMNI